MRGVAVTLTCPRCGEPRPPAADRAMITCVKCALVFTVEQGQREKPADREPEAATHELIADSNTPHLTISIAGDTMTVRLTNETWPSLVGVTLATVLVCFGIVTGTDAMANPTARVAIAFGCLVMAAIAVALAVANLRPTSFEIAPRGVRSRGRLFPMHDLGRATLEVRSGRARTSYSVMLDVAGTPVRLAMCTDSATAEAAIAAINDQIARLR